MLSLTFSIRNPFRHKKWHDIWQGAWPVTKHRTLEVCIDRYAFNLFSMEIDTAWRGSDHAGPSFAISLFGLGFTVSLPDNRHWDYTNNKWEDHEL